MTLAPGSICQQLGLIVDKANVGRINILRLRADAIAPAAEVRRVVLAEMGKGVDALFRRARIEDNLDEAEKAVVFDDEFNFDDGMVQWFNVQKFKVSNRFPTLNF